MRNPANRAKPWPSRWYACSLCPYLFVVGESRIAMAKQFTWKKVDSPPSRTCFRVTQLNDFHINSSQLFHEGNSHKQIKVQVISTIYYNEISVTWISY